MKLYRDSGVHAAGTILKILSILLIFLALTGARLAWAMSVRVGCFPMNNFCRVAGDGSLSGYGVEYTDALAGMAGWECKYVVYPSWVEALDGLSRGEIDLLAPSQHTEERDRLYDFDAFPIGTEYGSMLTLKGGGNGLVFEDFAAFNGLKVGCVKSLVFLDDYMRYEEEHGFRADITYYRDTPALLEALRSGEVKAIVANLMVRTDEMKVLARFGAAPFYYMVNPKAKGLLSELNRTIDRLNSQYPQFQRGLEVKYFGSMGQTPFSKRELDYIAKNPSISVGCAEDDAPFSYVDDSGGLDGINIDILEFIAEKTGLVFEFVPVPDGTDPAEYVPRHGLRLAAGVKNGGQTRVTGGMALTDACLTVSRVFIGLKSFKFDPSRTMTVALCGAPKQLVESWSEEHPLLKFVRCASAEECARAVREGRADLFLQNRYATARLLASPRNQDLRIMPTKGLAEDICFGFPADRDTELVSVFNKAIAQISDKDIEMFISNQVQQTQYRYTAPDFIYQYRVAIAAVSLSIIGFLCALGAALAARRKSQKKIAENEMRLRHITNNINGGVVVLKPDKGLQIVFANDGFLNLTGLSRREFEARQDGSYIAYVHPDDLPGINEAVEAGERQFSRDLRVMRRNGGYINTLFTCSVGAKTDGEYELYCVIMDMTEHLKLLERLRIENRRTELILDKVDEIFYEVNLSERSVTASSSFEAELGWSLPEAFDEGLRAVGGMWRTTPENIKLLDEATKKMLDNREPSSCTIRLESKKGYIWCEILQHPILGEDGEVVSVIGLIKDVNDIVCEREKLLRQAQTDPLTGLFNKEAFEKKVRQALQENPDQNHALLFMDMDHFKSVNDTLGHITGDRVICEAAEKLQLIFSNLDIVSRFGGDEFCIFVRNIPEETLRGKLEWMVEKMRAEYTNGAQSVRVSASCGAACTMQVGFDYAKLMQRADKALYASKERGRDRYTMADDSI